MNKKEQQGIKTSTKSNLKWQNAKWRNSSHHFAISDLVIWLVASTVDEGFQRDSFFAEWMKSYIFAFRNSR